MKLMHMNDEQFKEYQLKKIKGYFEKVNREFDKLSQNVQDDILGVRNDDYSLNHCIRWGLNSIEEILNFSKDD